MGRKYIVTQNGNDFDYNFATGIYDDWKTALGDVMEDIINEMENSEDEEVTISAYNDWNSGSFFNIVLKQPANKNHVELESNYRIFFLDDKTEE